MKRILVVMIAGLMGLFLTKNGLEAGGEPPKVGEMLPDFSLKIPDDAGYRAYLGLSGGGAFKVPQIKARLVIIEIFSMYCPYCQREAPEVNRLYAKVEADPKLKQQVKLIGIGAGNSAFEVDFFRKKYEVPFPLFPDETFVIHKCIGEVRTPYFIGVKIEKDGGHRVVFSELGGLKGADIFLNKVLELSGLDKEE